MVQTLISPAVSRKVAQNMDRDRRHRGALWRRADGQASLILCMCDFLIIVIGILSACELFEQLAHDRVIPAVFLTELPMTGSPVVSVLSFIAFSGLIYASTGASVTIMSEMYAHL